MNLKQVHTHSGVYVINGILSRKTYLQSLLWYIGWYPTGGSWGILQSNSTLTLVGQLYSYDDSHRDIAPVVRSSTPFSLSLIGVVIDVRVVEVLIQTLIHRGTLIPLVLVLLGQKVYFQYFQASTLVGFLRPSR
jgi:hypothetical protein